MTGKIKQQNLFLIENKPQLNQISTLGGLQFALMISVLMGYSPWRNAACEGASTSRGIHLWKKTLVKSRNSPLKLCGELSEIILSCRFKARREKFSSFISRFSFIFLRHFTQQQDQIFLILVSCLWTIRTGYAQGCVFQCSKKNATVQTCHVSNIVYQRTPIKKKIRSLKCGNFKIWSCFTALYVLLQMNHLRTKTKSLSVTCNTSCNTCFTTSSCIPDFVKISCKRQLFANGGQVVQNAQSFHESDVD